MSNELIKEEEYGPPTGLTDLLYLNGPEARHKVGALHGHLNGSCNPLPLGESVLGSALRGVCVYCLPAHPQISPTP